MAEYALDMLFYGRAFFTARLLREDPPSVLEMARQVAPPEAEMRTVSFDRLLVPTQPRIFSSPNDVVEVVVYGRAKRTDGAR